MTVRGIMLVSLAALLQAAANLLLRGGVLEFGEFSLSPERMKHQILVLGTQPMFLSGVVLYGSAAIVWFSVLSIENLNTSYPVLVGLTFILVAAGAAVFFNESFTWQKFVGMFMVLGGILFMVRS